MHKHYNYRYNLRQRSRRLRKESTLGEVLLWRHLRNCQLQHEFHRQFPIGCYILDFFCPELELAIEIDGGSHNESGAQERDVRRQESIEALGIRVIRFQEKEVRQRIREVLESIVGACEGQMERHGRT